MSQAIKEVLVEMRNQAVADRQESGQRLTCARGNGIEPARAAFDFNRGYADAVNDVLRVLIEKGLVQQ